VVAAIKGTKLPGRRTVYRSQILDAFGLETYLDCFKASDAAPSTPL
jgi:hypothetical protein